MFLLVTVHNQGKQIQELVQRPRKGAVQWLLTRGLLCLLSYIPQGHLSRVYITQGCGPHHQSLIKKKCLSDLSVNLFDGDIHLAEVPPFRYL